jgi:HK97 gp10 family phage protein
MSKGIKGFQRKMKAMPEAARKALAPATARGADEIARTAEALAPEDSGDLVGSVAVTIGPKNTPAHSHPGGIRTVPEGAAAVTAGNSDVRYAHLVEFGTTKAPAQPFFWPAFRSQRKRAETRIKRALSKAVKEEFNK